MGRNQKGKTNLDFTEARDSEWQWHQLGHMQVYTSLQTDNHTNTLPLSFYGPDALPDAQPFPVPAGDWKWLKNTLDTACCVDSFNFSVYDLSVYISLSFWMCMYAEKQVFGQSGHRPFNC